MCFCTEFLTFLFSLHQTILFDAHNLAQCQLSLQCLPLQCSQRRLCGHRGGSGDHICASCSKESVPKTQSRRHLNWPEMQEVRQDVYAYSSYVEEMSYPLHFQLLVFYSALGTLFSSVILAERTELSSPFPKLHLKGSLDELWIWNKAQFRSVLKLVSIKHKHHRTTLLKTLNAACLFHMQMMIYYNLQTQRSVQKTRTYGELLQLNSGGRTKCYWEVLPTELHNCW